MIGYLLDVSGSDLSHNSSDFISSQMLRISICEHIVRYSYYPIINEVCRLLFIYIFIFTLFIYLYLYWI
jgi:hypothetical protein